MDDPEQSAEERLLAEAVGGVDHGRADMQLGIDVAQHDSAQRRSDASAAISAIPAGSLTGDLPAGMHIGTADGDKFLVTKNGLVEDLTNEAKS